MRRLVTGNPINPTAADLLAHLMSEISEQSMAAGWLVNLEFDLWGLTQGAQDIFGTYVVEASDIAELRRLSAECGGWIIHAGPTQRQWIPIAEWLEMFEKGPKR